MDKLLFEKVVMLLAAFPNSAGIYVSTVLWPRIKELSSQTWRLMNNTSGGSVMMNQYPKPGTHSYLSVPGTTPLSELTIGKLFDEAASRFPNSEAIVVSTPAEVRKSYQELQTEVDKLAAGLLSIGKLEPGDKVGIWGPNSYEWYLTFLASVKCGLVVVHVNPAYQARELEYCINKVDIKAMVIADKFKSSNYRAMIAEICPEVESSAPGNIVGENTPTLTTLITFSSTPTPGAFTLKQLIREGSTLEALSELGKVAGQVQFDDLCSIQFSSGTTGNPKGIMLSHHTIVNVSYLLVKRLGYSQKDKLCLPVPLFHSFGCFMGALAAVHSGGTVVLPSPGYNPTEALKSISKERCTVVYGTPTMHIDLVNHPDLRNYDLSSLRHAITAGAICPLELARGMKAKYSIQNPTVAYGLSETSTVAVMSLEGDTEELVTETVGYPLEHVEVKIVNRNGKIVEVGQEGEICVRGFSVMKGYWKDPAKTSEAVDSSRWFYTGDLGVMVESGHLKIVGRLKDIIIRGGVNIHPRDIEDFLQTHPSIQEVQVFSVPDFRMGEEIGAWVKLVEGAELSESELRGFCKGKIAHFKVPKYVRFVKEFPTTSSGKIQKFMMREAMSQELIRGNARSL